MPTYRNANTGDVVELKQVNHRLEGLPNWERVEAEGDTDAARQDAVYVIDADVETGEELRETLGQATVAQLEALAAERGFDVSGAERKADLVEALAAAIEAESGVDEDAD